MNHIFTDDIFCAPATVLGTGAISVVRIRGKGCIALCDRVISLTNGRLADAAGYRDDIFGIDFLKEFEERIPASSFKDSGLCRKIVEDKLEKLRVEIVLG